MQDNWLSILPPIITIVIAIWSKRIIPYLLIGLLAGGNLLNLIVPLVSVILLSVFFFWFFGKDKKGNTTFISAITNTEPNRAMLFALFISIIISAIFYF